MVKFCCFHFHTDSQEDVGKYCVPDGPSTQQTGPPYPVLRVRTGSKKKLAGQDSRRLRGEFQTHRDRDGVDTYLRPTDLPNNGQAVAGPSQDSVHRKEVLSMMKSIPSGSYYTVGDPGGARRPSRVSEEHADENSNAVSLRASNSFKSRRVDVGGDRAVGPDHQVPSRLVAEGPEVGMHGRDMERGGTRVQHSSTGWFGNSRRSVKRGGPVYDSAVSMEQRGNRLGSDSAFSASQNGFDMSPPSSNTRCQTPSEGSSNNGMHGPIAGAHVGRLVCVIDEAGYIGDASLASEEESHALQEFLAVGEDRREELCLPPGERIIRQRTAPTEIPSLDLSKVSGYADKHRLPPCLDGITPRRLQQWQIDLTLSWIGEEDDHLVAEISHADGSTTPLAPHLPQGTAPAVSQSDAEQAEGGGLEVQQEVINIVDRMLLELKSPITARDYVNNRGPARMANVKDRVPTAHEQEDEQADFHAMLNVMGKQDRAASTANRERKQAILKDVQEQLARLEAAFVPLKQGTKEAAGQIEKAILEDVRLEVGRLEAELAGRNSPELARSFSEHLSPMRSVHNADQEGMHVLEPLQQPAGMLFAPSNKLKHQPQGSPDQNKASPPAPVARRASHPLPSRANSVGSSSGGPSSAGQDDSMLHHPSGLGGAAVRAQIPSTRKPRVNAGGLAEGASNSGRKGKALQRTVSAGNRASVVRTSSGRAAGLQVRKSSSRSLAQHQNAADNNAGGSAEGRVGRKQSGAGRKVQQSVQQPGRKTVRQVVLTT